MGRESAFEKKCVTILKKLPFSYWPDKGGAGSTIGNADRHGCVRGRYCSLEFKRSMADALAHTPRQKLQKYNADRVQDAHGYSAFVYPENWENVYREIKRIAYGR